MIFKNGQTLSHELKDFIKSSSSLYIFVPYIKLDVLKEVVNNTTNIKAVFVRWDVNDLIMGSSDLEVYGYLKSRGITLFRNSRIHLKAYLDNNSRCFITSANISSRALNIPAFKSYNHEIGTIVNSIDLEDLFYFKQIEYESTLITDDIYDQINNQVEFYKRNFNIINDHEFIIEKTEKDFLISSLPMTPSAYELIDSYSILNELKSTKLNCVIHDLTLYGIDLNLSLENLHERLKLNFFNHPFIRAFEKHIEDNDKEIYFGKAKEWIHRNCEDVPLPRKWEITENIQILFRWFEDLGDGRYEVDIPNYSQRMKKY